MSGARSVGAAYVACVLTEHADSAEGEQAYEESDGDDSDSDSEDEDDIPRPEASANSQIPPVVDGFMNLKEAKCLAELYMAPKGQSPPNSDSKRKQRQAFLSLPRNDWIMSHGKKKGTIICLRASVYEQLWRRRCVAQMPERENHHARGHLV